MNNIPVIINNRDLFTWPKEMINKIKTFNKVGDIFIIDNGSTYEPLLEWYETKPCEIIRLDNIGHKAPWVCGLVNKLNKEYYIVTDPDLGLTDLPNDTLEILQNKLEITPQLGKIGLGLKWEYIGDQSKYYNHLQTYEKSRWLKSRNVDDVFIDVAIDTTFALYNKKEYFIGGGSLSDPYRCYHYPWNFTNETLKNNDEFTYYLNNALNNVCSYKLFL